MSCHPTSVRVTRVNDLPVSLSYTNSIATVEGLESLPATLQFAYVAERGSWVYSVIPEVSTVKRQHSSLQMLLTEEVGCMVWFHKHQH